MQPSSPPPLAATDPRSLTTRWLTIVGIGEDGPDGLGRAAREAIAAAAVVFGGARHLALAGPLITGEARAWPTPFDTAPVTALRGRRVCVLASGDPFRHGVGATLARRVDPAEMTVLPAPSAFSLAAARLGWPLAEVEAISLHGRPEALIRPLLHPGTRILALTSDGDAPARVARRLTATGFGPSRLHVLEALGGPDERHHTARAADLGDARFAALNLLAVEVEAGEDAQILPLGGLDDGLFEHDGQITKREVRAVTLAALAPRRGELLWDVGAGAGSVAIEWMLRHPSLRAIAIEADPERAARIRRNAEVLGTPGLDVREGRAPAALAGLPPPDAIFLGGGGAGGGTGDGTGAGLLDTLTAVLPGGGRLVANAVTLEMQALLTATAGRLGGALVTVSIARAGPVGGMSAWRPAMPVVQWSWVKP
ncbi:precorrin-6Y C5,15-methyltransferase (decarboxylating) [Amaricoccus macauensis]|uniref:Precorrin-6Y C5,15-methyltransferase (Decarboxylating) n=1 Tax=Amaricoccus macauensis TaxID=57001 RepID=A0A840SPS0_9RHOB|nr:precorrin-6y C5,15-methyltransferase (decarboxylating) subunit CbiE [Amaricoccus macauensis]MBB5224027.1 precorrin-6Y C5,15-methyltransferase (decarboxylating) [Amaricoccus macauensis]